MKTLSWFSTLLALLGLPSLAFAIDLTPSASDPSVMYLSYMFGVVNGVLHGSGTQILGKMFDAFNMAVLMLAAIVAVYTTVMAILNTGQDGEFLGKKWNSLFVPVRVLFGVLLIMPTSTGYSWIQVIVMWIVLQGVGAANYVWQEAVTYLQGGGVLFVVNSSDSQNGQIANANYSTVYGGMQNLSNSVFCLEAMNVALNKLSTSSAYYSVSPAQHAPPSESPLATLTDKLSQSMAMSSDVPVTTTLDLPNYPVPTSKNPNPGPDTYWSFLNGICGKLSFTSGASAQKNADGSFSNRTALGLQQALYDLDGGVYFPSNNICAVSCADTSPTSACETKYHDLIQSPNASTCDTPTGYDPTTVTASAHFPIFAWNTVIPKAYSQTLANATNDYLGLVGTYSTSANTSTLDAKSTWIDAGTYFFQLMAHVGGSQSLNGATFHISGSDGATGTLGQGSVETWAGIPASNSIPPYLQACDANVQKDCVSYPATLKSDAVAYMEGIMLPLVASGNLSTGANIYVVGKFDQQQTDVNGNAQPQKSHDNLVAGGSDHAYQMLDVLTGSASDLYNAINNLTQIHNTDQNPINNVMQIGQAMIDMAFNTWLTCTAIGVALGAAIGAIPCVTVSTGISIAFMGIFSLIIGLVAPLLIAGMGLMFLFPLMPFMIYSFGVIGWMIGVVEAMVAAPIVGIGIMHPEGHDVFGKGEQALMLMLNMFLRPSLMVFGLITSIMMVYIGVFIINSGINTAINFVNSYVGSAPSYTNTVAMVAIPLVYTVIILQMTGKCFTMIYLLPDKVTRWLSGGLQESLGSDMAGVQEQVKQSAQSGMSSFGGAVGKGAEMTTMQGHDKAHNGYLQAKKKAKEKLTDSSKSSAGGTTF